MQYAKGLESCIRHTIYQQQTLCRNHVSKSIVQGTQMKEQQSAMWRRKEVVKGKECTAK